MAAQADQVDEDEELDQPARGDEGVVFGLEGADDAPEGHVQRGGDEGRGGEDEEALEDKGEDGVGVVVGGGAEVVGAYFSYAVIDISLGSFSFCSLGYIYHEERKGRGYLYSR